MNILLIVTGMIFLICGILGMAQGFIKIAASLAATILTIVCVMFISPYVSKMILKVTPLESMVQEKCAEVLNVQDMSEIEGAGQTEIPREQQILLLENAKLPKIFREMLLENNNSEIYQFLGVQTFAEYIGGYLAKVIADYVGFLLTLVVVTIIVRSIVSALGIISRLPVIGGLNRLAGGVLGLGTGLVIIWVMFIVITLMYDSSIGRECFESIRSSRLLGYLYENNILMNFISKFR